MRYVLWIMLTVLFWCVTDPVSAAQSIRVLLEQQAKKVTVQGDRGLIVTFANGERRSATRPVTVSVAAGHLVMNGTRVHSPVAVFHARGGDLSVVITSQMIPAPTRDSGGGVKKFPLSSMPSQSFRIGGALQIMARDGAMLIINDIDMEEYVKGVVPSEMSAGWHLEALKVQAVATRTYALYQRLANAGREFDVVASTQDQVYRGRQGVDERVQQAVEATRDIVITYQDVPILAAFSSTAAGPTEDAMNVWSKDLPYLKGVECPFDENSPYYQWRVELPVLSLEQSLRKQGIPVGTIATVTPFLYSRAGRVDKIRILHSDGEVILRGQDFRKAVGYSVIPSTQFEIEALGRMVVFAGRGSGHAVGLCQWGAKELAGQGYPYDAILRYYFPGTELKQTASLRLSNP
ncbi:MAG TPA: SpoIID/LytB domain-containing protein [Nitrospiraceae bacterium]|nr:SpoIID/LytB domain-containing protein [Nitrospiraceae bacterium]